MPRVLHFILGYLFGISIFFMAIPYGFFLLSRLDYLVDYRMIIGSIAVRYALSGVLVIIGFLFIIWSNLYLFTVGKGGPAEGMGVSLSPKTRKLVISGPYRYCRNPMVFGAMILYLALVIFLNSFTGLFALVLMFIAASFYLRKSEEKRLLKDYGDDYSEYRKKVPMIIPGRQNRRLA